MASLIDESGRRRIIYTQVIGFDFAEGYVSYEIEIRIANVHWMVRRRFSEFFTLHQTLCSQRAFEMRSLSARLPPKKASIGGLSTRLAEQRQRALSVYLQALVELFDSLPVPLAKFLLWDKYEVQGITSSLTEYIFEKGTAWLASGHAFEFSVVQVYAVNKRLEIAVPTCQPGQSFRTDFGHLLEFIARLPVAGVYASPGQYGSSDLPARSLPVCLAPFRSLRQLQLTCVRPAQLTGLDRLPLTDLRLRRCSPDADAWDDAELLSLFDQLPMLERLSADSLPGARLSRLLGPDRAARVLLNGRPLIVAKETDEAEESARMDGSDRGSPSRSSTPAATLSACASHSTSSVATPIDANQNLPVAMPAPQLAPFADSRCLSTCVTGAERLQLAAYCRLLTDAAGRADEDLEDALMERPPVSHLAGLTPDGHLSVDGRDRGRVLSLALGPGDACLAMRLDNATDAADSSQSQCRRRRHRCCCCLVLGPRLTRLWTAALSGCPARRISARRLLRQFDGTAGAERAGFYSLALLLTGVHQLVSLLVTDTRLMLVDETASLADGAGLPSLLSNCSTVSIDEQFSPVTASDRLSMSAGDATIACSSGDPGSSACWVPCRPAALDAGVDGDKQLVHGESDVTDQPAVGQSDVTDQPAVGESDVTHQPAVGESDVTDQPAVGESDVKDQPAVGESDVKDQPAVGESDIADQPAVGESDIADQPAVGESDIADQLAVRESDVTDQPAVRESDVTDQPAVGESDIADQLAVRENAVTDQPEIRKNDGSGVASSSIPDAPALNPCDHSFSIHSGSVSAQSTDAIESTTDEESEYEDDEADGSEAAWRPAPYRASLLRCFRLSDIQLAEPADIGPAGGADCHGVRLHLAGEAAFPSILLGLPSAQLCQALLSVISESSLPSQLADEAAAETASVEALEAENVALVPDQTVTEESEPQAARFSCTAVRYSQPGVQLAVEVAVLDAATRIRVFSTAEQAVLLERSLSELHSVHVGLFGASLRLISDTDSLAADLTLLTRDLALTETILACLRRGQSELQQTTPSQEEDDDPLRLFYSTMRRGSFRCPGGRPVVHYWPGEQRLELLRQLLVCSELLFYSLLPLDADLSLVDEDVSHVTDADAGCPPRALVLTDSCAALLWHNVAQYPLSSCADRPAVWPEFRCQRRLALSDISGALLRTFDPARLLLRCRCDGGSELELDLLLASSKEPDRFVRSLKSLLPDLNVTYV